MTSSTRPPVEHLDSSLVFSTVEEGSGPTDTREQPPHSPLPPAAALYVEMFGWPVKVRGDEVAVSCGNVLDVTTMPRGFACEVNHLLRAGFLRAPIVELSGLDGQSARWAFLSLPKRSADNDDRMPRLASFEVQHYGAGATFPLPPSPTCASDALRWAVPPPFGTLKVLLPPWESITACALTAKYRATGR
jgi:hypothetical protein